MSQYEEGLRDLDRLLGYIAKTRTPTEALHAAETVGEGRRVVSTLQKATVAASGTGSFGATGLGSQWGELYSQARSIGVADLAAQSAIKMPRANGRFNLMASVIGSTPCGAQPEVGSALSSVRRPAHRSPVFSVAVSPR